MQWAQQRMTAGAYLRYSSIYQLCAHMYKGVFCTMCNCILHHKILWPRDQDYASPSHGHAGDA